MSNPSQHQLPEGNYWIVQPVLRGGMLLAPLARPSEDESWTIGQRFASSLVEPVVVKIRSGYEDASPRPFLGVPPVMSDRLATVLRSAGVGNLDLYDAELRSSDGAVALRGYKAFNLIGLVEAADISATRFAAASTSRLIDAAIDSLAIDESAIGGQLMFRLAEQTSAIMVHRKIRAAIEVAGIEHIKFVSPSEFIG